MTCQRHFPKKQKTRTNLSSAQFAQRVVKVDTTEAYNLSKECKNVDHSS